MTTRAVSDERSDRAVRVVLWASLALALVPIVVALVLVQPMLNRLTGRYGGDILHSELTAGRPSLGDPLVSMVSKSARAGLFRVLGRPGPEPAAPQTPERFSIAFDSARLANRPLECVGVNGPERPGEAGARCVWLRPAFGVVATSPSARTGLSLTPRNADADGSEPVALDESATDAPRPGPRSEDAPTLALDNAELALFAAQVGSASLMLSGEVDNDAFASLRPIEEAGVGRYLSGDPEIHHGVLTGRAAAVFAEANFARASWRVRPEIDIGAEYLALDKVRLDAGEAGLFLPKTEDWLFSARPSLALEGEITAAPGVRVMPRVRAGATWLSQTEFTTAASMLDVPTPFIGLMGMGGVSEDIFTDVEAGLGLAASDRLQFSVSYGGLYGEAFESHGGQVELSMQF